MMISEVLCKINEKINHLSIFHDHVVPADLIAQLTGKTIVKS